MAKVIIGMIPPGGWHYFDSDAKLTAHSYEGLLKVVEDYRAENHLPVGDVEGDVNSYICSNWPNFCHGVDMVVVKSVHPESAQQSLLNDITTWARNLLNSKTVNNLVSNELAEERAKICKGCQHNKNWRGGCSSCIAAADRISASVRNGRDTQSSTKLGGCNIMRHDNRSAIFFDKNKLSQATSTPDNCWMNIK
jgi:hypothetical protein